jgi:rhodanese-related sulfurtransferase
MKNNPTMNLTGVLHVNGDQAGFDRAHIRGATYFPHATMTEETLTGYPKDTMFVVYCSGPHCNGADKAALKVARLRK